MRSGELHDRITIEEPIRGKGALGDDVITGWTAVGSRWADVQADPDAGGETVEGNKPVGRHPYTVKMRLFPGLTPAHSIGWDGKRLQIVSVADIDDFTLCRCVETKGAA